MENSNNKTPAKTLEERSQTPNSSIKPSAPVPKTPSPQFTPPPSKKK